MISNLNCESKQADRAVLDLLSEAGVSVTVHKNSVRAARSDLKAFTFDATDSPDLFPRWLHWHHIAAA
jgi:3-phosphoshikimate 1-carboxyvinyltransferase